MTKHDGLRIHLVGSVPLADSEAVFRTVCDAVGPYLPRVPDGETGERRYWIGYVRDMLGKHPDLELDHSVPPLQLQLWNGTLHREVPLLRFRDRSAAHESSFTTRYAAMALDSYRVFQRLRGEGAIPGHVRFMVALPTPLAITYNYISPTSRPRFIASYTAHLLRELEEITRQIPAEQLSIQWDILQEILMWENYYGHRAPDYKEEIVAVLARISNAVPQGVDLGYHYCYGSPRDEHLIQPKDTGVMVEITNLVAPKLTRSLDFIHLPVPKGRTDAAYYAPLRDLRIGSGTELYLGLVHQNDSDGNRKRLAEASRHVTVAGVASECGWGRGEPARVPGLLEAHRELVTSPMQAV